MMNVDVCIIGGGPAGLTAAVYALRAGRSVLVIEGSGCGGQLLLAHEIENYPGFVRVSGMELADAMTAQAKELGAQFLWQNADAVTREEDHFVVTAGKNAIVCRAVIAASGTKRRKLGIPGEDTFAGRGVSYCAVCDGRFFKGRDVAVVGGGNTALGDALYLSHICHTVTVIHRRDTFRADHLTVERARNTENIHLLTDTRVESVLGENTVQALSLVGENAGELSVSGVFVAAGSEPNVQYLQTLPELARDAGGYLVTDERCRTAIPGLYAAGDVRAKNLRQIATATADGAICGVEATEYLDAIL